MVESINTFDKKFLNKHFFSSKPKFVMDNSCKIWTNNLEVSFSNKLTFVEFNVEFIPAIGNDHLLYKHRIFNLINIRKELGLNLYTGNSVFIKENENKPFEKYQNFTYNVHYKSNNNKYTIILKNTNARFNLGPELTNNLENLNLNITNLAPIKKMLYELTIKDIILANPDIELDRRLFVLKNESEKINYKSGSVTFYPGFQTSINVIDSSVYINISIKNRFLQDKNCLKIIQELKGNNKNLNENKITEIQDFFLNRIVKTTYSKKNYRIHSIKFDENPNTKKIPYNGEVINLLTYFYKAYSVEIINKEQPLIEVINRDNELIYLIPELCILTGVDDSMIADRNFMKNLSMYTKHDPSQKVDKTNLLKRIMESKKTNEYKSSAKEKMNEHKVNISNDNKIINGYILRNPDFYTKQNNLKSNELERRPVHHDRLSNSKIAVVYNAYDYEAADILVKSLKKAGKELKLNFPEPYYLEVSSTSKNAKDYIKLIEDSSQYNLVVYLVSSKNDHFYKTIKEHSLCNQSSKGYLSQVVKTGSVTDKRKVMGVCTKLLLQMNNKLGGLPYVLKHDNSYKNENLMIIGVDSSHISGKRTGVAMVSTVDSTYAYTYSHESIIKEENKEQICYAVGKFVNEALIQYYSKNKQLPSGIVIYRQGVSKEQKEFLKLEVDNIEKFLDGSFKESVLSSSKDKNFKIPYLYVIVNVKNNYKFFEVANSGSNASYRNPKEGLAIYDGATDGKYFEFFLQPQKVTQGTATPSHFHVAFGNMENKEMISKLTYDLCYIYPNWSGPVRVPNVLKNAEKLAKIVGKCVKKEVNENLKNYPYYL